MSTDPGLPDDMASAALAETDVLDSREAGGKIIRGGGLRVGTYIGSLLIGLISAPLLIRHLSVADYGLFVTGSAIAFVVGGITEGGLANVAVRGYAVATPPERARLLDALLGLRLGLTALGAALAVLFTLAAGYPPEVTVGFAILSAGLLLGAWQNTIAVALQAQLRLGSLAGADLVRQVTTTAMIALLVVLGAELLAFWTVAPVGFAAMLWATLLVARRHRLRLRPGIDRARWAGLLRETAVYAVATSLGVIYFQVAIMSVSLLSTDVEAGFYGACFRIVEIANGVPWILASSAFPLLARAAHNDLDRLRYATQRLFETGLLAGGLFAIGAAVGAPVALDVLGGSKLDPALPTLQILAAGIPFTFLIATWAFTLLSLKRHRALLVSNGLAVAAAVVLSVLLIPEYGASGAAVTTLSLEVLLACLYCTSLVRARPDLRPSLGVLPRLIAAAAPALAAGFLLPLPAAPAALLAVAVYGGLALALRAVPAEIAEAIRERVRPRA